MCACSWTRPTSIRPAPMRTPNASRLPRRVFPMTRLLQDVLDGDVPDDVPEWIVEFHIAFDQCHLQPLQAALLAYAQLNDGHTCLVTHVRSGLQWSIALDRRETVEVTDRRE